MAVGLLDLAQPRPGPSALGELKPGSTQLDEANARLVAVREGIDLVVSGEVTTSGAGYKIVSDVTDALTGKTLSTEGTNAKDKSNILRAVADFADQMRTPWAIQLLSRQNWLAETFITASLEATHEYALGN